MPEEPDRLPDGHSDLPPEGIGAALGTFGGGQLDLRRVDEHSPAFQVFTEQSRRSILVNAKAPRTKVEYERSWQHFNRWCFRNDFTPMPAKEGVILLYLAHYGGLIGDLLPEAQGRRVKGQEYLMKPSSLHRYLSAIKHKHLSEGLPFPSYERGQDPMRTLIDSEITQHQERLRGRVLTRSNRAWSSDRRQAQAITQHMLIAMLKHTDNSVMGVRDRALLLAAFTTACRRSELAGLDLTDVAFEDEGMRVFIRRSKTDQTGSGRYVYVRWGRHEETCAVRQLQQWVRLRQPLGDGPLFLPVDKMDRIRVRREELPNGEEGPIIRVTGHGIFHIVRRCVEAVWLDNDRDPRYDPRLYSPHSLRAGFATEAARGGASIKAIMDQTGHESAESALGYVRAGVGYQDSPTQFLQLL